MSYETLNDAAEVTGINGLRPGKTEIWYMNDKGWQTFPRGPALALKLGHALPIGHDVGKSGTHVLLGEIQATNLGGIFGIMQGESWSPNGECNNLLRSKKLSHSSMSVGDIIVLPNGAGHMVDSVGFFELPKNAAEQKDQVRKAQGDISPMLRKESVGMRDVLRRLEEGVPTGASPDWRDIADRERSFTRLCTRLYGELTSMHEEIRALQGMYPAGAVALLSKVNAIGLDVEAIKKASVLISRVSGRAARRSDDAAGRVRSRPEADSAYERGV